MTDNTHVQAYTHLLERDWRKVINVDTPRAQLILGVRRNEFSDEVGTCGEFCQCQYFMKARRIWETDSALE